MCFRSTFISCCTVPGLACGVALALGMSPLASGNGAQGRWVVSVSDADDSVDAVADDFADDVATDGARGVTGRVGASGAPLAARFVAPRVVRLRAAAAAIADAHPFVIFNLAKKPSMLLGIETLRIFKRVSIDFATRKVKFLLPGER